MNDISKTKRSLREVLPRGSRGRPVNEPGLTVDRSDQNQFFSGPPVSSGRSWKLIIAVVVVVSLFAGFAFSKIFAQAVVRVTPVQGRLLLNHTFKAEKSPIADELAFIAVSGLGDVERRSLPAVGSETVQQKAAGKITIYNNYDSKPQKLIANTRFDAGGKIFRINESVTVPGLKKSAGETIPGSIEVAVTADQPGVEFNIGPSDFSIPGFKGDPRYGKISAKSKTSMIGGLIGEVKKIDPAVKSKARQEMTEILRERLFESTKLEAPADFILFPDATYLVFEEEIKAASSSAATAELILSGKLYGLLFKRKDLTRQIATLIPDYDGSEITIPNLDKLIFRLANKESLASPSLERVSFVLEGNAILISVFNEQELIERLAAAADRNYEKVFNQYPTIDRAEISFRPLWLRRVPTDPKRIKIQISLEGQD